MSEAIDPYRDWLGISDPRRPPNYYQLLGLRAFEADAERIWAASMSRMAVALEHDPGPHAELARRLFDEIEQARNCLADRQQKAAYDVLLLREQIAASPGAAPTADLPDDDPRVHVLNEADEHQMMVVAQNLSDSQAALLKSRLVSLKAKAAASTSLSASTSSYYGPKPGKSVGGKGGQPLGPRARLLVLSGVSMATAMVVVAAWLGVAALVKEPPPPDPVAPLVAELRHPDVKVRVVAARKLAELGPRMSEALPHLVKVLETDESNEVRAAVVQTLVEAGPSLDAVVQQLTLLAEREPDPNVRRLIKGLVQSTEEP